jgi:tetratricopeptide (TPR) repeat protein
MPTTGFTVSALLVALLCVPPVASADPASLDQPADAEAMEREVESASREIASDPQAARAYVRRGEARFRLHEFDRAIEDFSAALQLDDRQDDAWFGRGMAHGRNGDIDRGIADLGVYIERHPDSSLAHTKRGVRRLWQGDLAGAERDLARAVALDPRNAEAHDDLGVIHAQQRDYARAIEHFTATVRLDPGYQKAWHNLAMACHLIGRNADALAAVDTSLLLNPDNRNSLLLKAEILKTLGRLAEAKRLQEDAEFATDGNWSERMKVH